MDIGLPKANVIASAIYKKTKAMVEKQEMRVIETTKEKCYTMLVRKEWI